MANKELTLGSLFSGSEGFELGGILAAYIFLLMLYSSLTISPNPRKKLPLRNETAQYENAIFREKTLSVCVE